MVFQLFSPLCELLLKMSDSPAAGPAPYVAMNSRRLCCWGFDALFRQLGFDAVFDHLGRGARNQALGGHTYHMSNLCTHAHTHQTFAHGQLWRPKWYLFTIFKQPLRANSAKILLSPSTTGFNLRAACLHAVLFKYAHAPSLHPPPLWNGSCIVCVWYCNLPWQWHPDRWDDY